MAQAYTDETLELAPERATRFLCGIGAVPEVRTLLFEYGMTGADIEEGRANLLECLAQPESTAAELDTADARAQRAAVAQLDQEDEGLITRIGATLRRYHPSAAQYVLGGVAAAKGPRAVQGVGTILARLDALANGTDPARATTREEDVAAVELLARRGITAQERTRLGGLVLVALGPTEPLPVAPVKDDGERRRRALITLRAWFDDWSATARSVIRKRNHLIRLGLASRRAPAAKGATDPGDGGDTGDATDGSGTQG